jgi:hypothetical protein
MTPGAPSRRRAVRGPQALREAAGCARPCRTPGAWRRSYGRPTGEDPTVSDQVQRLLDRLEAVWAALTESYAGVPESTLVEPGVVDDWSVKDVLAHVTTWEEAPRHLPLIIAGGTPPRVCGAGRHRRLQRPRHRGRAAPVPGGGPAPAGRAPTRLLEFIRSQPEGTSPGQTRARRRLRLDTYGHNPRAHRRHQGMARSPAGMIAEAAPPLSGCGPGAWHVAARAWSPKRSARPGRPW